MAREAIEAWLRERRKTVLREAIADYAARHAGTLVDLDPVLEAAGIASLQGRPGAKARARGSAVAEPGFRSPR